MPTHCNWLKVELNDWQINNTGLHRPGWDTMHLILLHIHYMKAFSNIFVYAVRFFGGHYEANIWANQSCFWPTFGFHFGLHQWLTKISIWTCKMFLVANILACPMVTDIRAFGHLLTPALKRFSKLKECEKWFLGLDVSLWVLHYKRHLSHHSLLINC